MHLTGPLTLSALLLLPLPALAALNGRCSGSAATGQWKAEGICVKTSTCKKYKGTTKNNACPYDDDDVKCCIIDACDGPDDGGLGPYSFCTWTNDDFCKDYGVFLDNKCPGNSNYKCCFIP